MAQPTKKNPALEAIFTSVFGVDRIDCIERNICVSCGNSAVEFSNEISKKEFTISGLCQACQDESF